MFYVEPAEQALRFGDVVKGFVLSSSDVPGDQKSQAEYCIKVVSPPYCVVMSPCCSIGAKTLALAPLQQVTPKMLENRNWAENLTCINRPMSLEKAVPPEHWKNMTQDEKDRRGYKDSYALDEFFVLEANALLPKYDLKCTDGKTRETGHYMIDFKRISRIECAKVNAPKQAPLEAKVLELSIQARGDLRDKLSHYFGRVPPEDEE
jgi:hypothetical protein